MALIPTLSIRKVLESGKSCTSVIVKSHGKFIDLIQFSLSLLLDNATFTAAHLFTLGFTPYEVDLKNSEGSIAHKKATQRWL
jgi:hypothetical protein